MTSSTLAGSRYAGRAAILILCWILITAFSAISDPLLQDGSADIPKIGQMHQGGIVFWLDGKGGGLVVAPNGWSGTEDDPQARFGCSGIRIQGTTDGFGAGSTNTKRILEQCPDQEPTAAKLASDAVINGFDDWYLPSKQELQAIHEKLHKGSVIKLRNDFYWSSTQSSGLLAWSFSMAKGTAFSYDKMDSDHVRPVRKF